MLAKDIYQNSFLQKMRNGHIVSSMTVKLVKGIEIAQIAKTAGFDAIYIDLEHSALTLESTGQICMAAMNIGLSPFVRVPANTPEWICRALDNGAMGVIAPHINTKEQAQAIVACAKFQPIGDRSAAGVLPHLQYRSFPASEAYPVLNDQTTVIVQFESEQAIENAESIISTPGVDVVLIGSNDLTADMGIAGLYDHPKLRAAFEHTIKVCKAHGKFCGVGGLSSRADLVAQFTAMGASYVSTGTDLAFLISAASEKAKQVKALNS